MTIVAGAEPRYLVYSGEALATTLFRVTSTCPPTAGDFISYAQTGRSFPSDQFFRAVGVSFWKTAAKTRKMAMSGHIGRCYAEVDLRRDEWIYFAVTNEQTGHVTVWAPPRVLLNSVVNCVEEGREES